MVVSLDGDSSEHIFSIVQRFYHRLPSSEKETLKTVASNRKELKFEEPHSGRILVETAGKTSAGHSFTIRYLLMSEYARWPEGCVDAEIGLLNAVPNEPDTMIIKESVANGMSGDFYNDWNNPDSDYIKIFLPWFEHTEYQMQLPIAKELYEAQLIEEEKQQVSLYNLSLEQIEWRRWCIKNNCKDDPEKFKEQYPATPTEAFIASGSSFFHIPTLDAIKTSEPLRCNLEVFEDLSHKKETRLVPNPRGYWRLWKKPQPNHHYVWGGDVAEGIEIEGAPNDDRHDYSPADFLDRATGEQVAQFHGKVTPDEFGRQLALGIKYYNDAYGAPEVNAGYGGHVLDTLQREAIPQSLIYRHQILDEITRRPTRKIGWMTTKANKRTICSQLDMAIRRNEVFVNSEETVRELKSFVTKPSGRIEAGEGNKDDRVMSLAIANQMLLVAPAMQDVPMSSSNQGSGVTKYTPWRSIVPRRKEQNPSSARVVIR